MAASPSTKRGSSLHRMSVNPQARGGNSSSVDTIVKWEKESLARSLCSPCPASARLHDLRIPFCVTQAVSGLVEAHGKAEDSFSIHLEKEEVNLPVWVSITTVHLAAPDEHLASMAVVPSLSSPAPSHQALWILPPQPHATGAPPLLFHSK